jgi:hypothetical protein
VVKTVQRAMAFMGLLTVVSVGGLALTPGEVDPVAWTPAPTMPMEGALAPNDRLQAAQPLGRGEIYGPEDVDVDSEGRFYAALEDGRIVRVDGEGSVEDWVETGGRPLGMDFDPTGNLIVCDAQKGLLSVAPDGTVTTLATEADGLPFGFADDVDVGRDGVIYFSDASWRWKYPNFMNDLFESKPYGRLMRYDPRKGEVEVLADSLYFANGVACRPMSPLCSSTRPFGGGSLGCGCEGRRKARRRCSPRGSRDIPTAWRETGEGIFMWRWARSRILSAHSWHPDPGRAGSSLGSQRRFGPKPSATDS